MENCHYNCTTRRDAHASIECPPPNADYFPCRCYGTRDRMIEKDHWLDEWCEKCAKDKHVCRICGRDGISKEENQFPDKCMNILGDCAFQIGNLYCEKHEDWSFDYDYDFYKCGIQIKIENVNIWYNHETGLLETSGFKLDQHLEKTLQDLSRLYKKWALSSVEDLETFPFDTSFYLV